MSKCIKIEHTKEGLYGAVTFFAGLYNFTQNKEIIVLPYDTIDEIPEEYLSYRIEHRHPENISYKIPIITKEFRQQNSENLYLDFQDYVENYCIIDRNIKISASDLRKGFGLYVEQEIEMKCMFPKIMDRLILEHSYNITKKYAKTGLVYMGIGLKNKSNEMREMITELPITNQYVTIPTNILQVQPLVTKLTLNINK